MISRIRSPFYIFFLNPVYVAARSLRSLRSNYNNAICFTLIINITISSIVIIDFKKLLYSTNTLDKLLLDSFLFSLRWRGQLLRALLKFLLLSFRKRTGFAKFVFDALTWSCVYCVYYVWGFLVQFIWLGEVLG